MISEFKAAKIEEECFGSGDPKSSQAENPFEDFFENKSSTPMMIGPYAQNDTKTNYGRSAYILVYEKKIKHPLTLEFTPENIAEKDAVIESIVQEDKKAEIVESVTESGNTLVKVPYHGIKSFIPKHLDNEINQDNFRFLIEQQVYSNEFLKFVTEVWTFPQLGDFNPRTLPTRILEIKIPDKFRELLYKVIRMQFTLFQNVIAKTEENNCIDVFCTNMMKIISVCPEYSSELIRNEIMIKFPTVMNLLVHCPDSNVRKNMGELISHLFLVNINYFEIELPLNHTAEVNQLEVPESEDFFEDRGKVIMNVLVRMMDGFEVRNLPHRKMEAFFRMWYTLAKRNKNLTHWLISKGHLARRLLSNRLLITAFYMSKSGNQYESKNGYYQHEQAIDHCIRLAAYLFYYIRDYYFVNPHAVEEGKTPLTTQEDMNVIFTEALYEKLLGENYNFNNYKSMKRLLNFSCGVDHCSDAVIRLVLKNLGFYVDNILSYLEALKEVVMIKDKFSERRREYVFGIPTVAYDSNYRGNGKLIGFQNAMSLDRAALVYLSPLDPTGYVNSFIQTIVEAQLKSETNCYIMLVYLLQMINGDQDIFNYIIHLPSPFHAFENFYDWIFAFAKKYIEQESMPAQIATYRQSRLFDSTMKEQLMIFEDNILNYVRVKHPNAASEYTIITHPTSEIFHQDPKTSEVFIMENLQKPILPLCINPIIGSVVNDEIISAHRILEDDRGALKLIISRLKCRIADSQANGITNLALPIKAFTGVRIYEQDVPSGSFLQTFLALAPETKLPDLTKFVELPESDNFPSRTQPGAGNMTYRHCDYVLKLSMNNGMGRDFGIAFRIRPKNSETDLNLHYFKSSFVAHIRQDTTSNLVARFIKVDPEKPFGDFEIDCIYTPLSEFTTIAELWNILKFNPNVPPMSFEILPDAKKESEARQQTSAEETELKNSEMDTSF